MYQKIRHLAWALYAVALLLIAMPISDLIVASLPMRLGDVQWRFGFAGRVSGALLTPLLGMLMAVVTAALVGHRRTTRVLSVLSIGGAVLGVLAIVMFSLDAMQVRPQVRVETLEQLDMATITAISKLALGALAALLLGIGGWKAARPQPRVADAPSRASADEDEDSHVLISSQQK